MKKGEGNGSSISKCVLSFSLYMLKTETKDALFHLNLAINEQTSSLKCFQLCIQRISLKTVSFHCRGMKGEMTHFTSLSSSVVCLSWRVKCCYLQLSSPIHLVCLTLTFYIVLKSQTLCNCEPLPLSELANHFCCCADVFVSGFACDATKIICHIWVVGNWMRYALLCCSQITRAL